MPEWNWFQWATFVLGSNCIVVGIGAFQLGWWRLGCIFVIYGIADYLFIGMRGS